MLRAALLAFLFGCATAPRPSMSPTTPLHASGTFEVKLAPLPTAEGMGRFSLDKTFHGDLEGTSRGEMLSAGNPREGTAGYVAVEVVTGALHGRRGTFALQHLGSMKAGAQELTIQVVPGSGTGELKGLEGRLSIEVRDGQHRYRFDATR